jgi:hypothetical protein
MNLFGAEYELASHGNLKKNYFRVQLQATQKPKVTKEMLKKLDNNVTLFGHTIKRGDILLLGLSINEIKNSQVSYNFFYCTREELKELGNGDYYVSYTDEGIPKVIGKNLMKKYGKIQEK